jgi:hypothetical protein
MVKRGYSILPKKQRWRYSQGLGRHLFADGAYDRTRLTDAATYQDFVLGIVRRTDKEAGFKVLPKRWVVERPLVG